MDVKVNGTLFDAIRDTEYEFASEVHAATAHSFKQMGDAVYDMEWAGKMSAPSVKEQKAA